MQKQKKMQKTKKNGMRLPSKKKLAKLFTKDDIAPEFGPQRTSDEILERYGVVPENPDTYKEELVELIDQMFMFDGFPGFENGVKKTGKILREYGVRPDSPAGQYVLNTFIEHALSEEYYSNFEHSADCEKCGKEFEPAYSIEYANNILKGKAFCPACKK